MTDHLKIMMKFWGMNIADVQEQCCWKCNRNGVIDLCHISPRGMGGRESQNYPENLIFLCRACHKLTEGNQQMMGLLWGILVKKILAHDPNHKWSDNFKLTWYYKSELKNVYNHLPE